MHFYDHKFFIESIVITLLGQGLVLHSYFLKLIMIEAYDFNDITSPLLFGALPGFNLPTKAFCPFCLAKVFGSC